MLQALVARITLRSDAVDIKVRRAALVQLLQPRTDLSAVAADGATTVLSVPAMLKRTGLETKLLVNSAQTASREPDRSLLRLLGQAHQFRDMVMAGQGKSMLALAGEVGVHPPTSAAPSGSPFSSPAIIHALLQGRQPIELTANKLNQTSKLAIAWTGSEAAARLRLVSGPPSIEPCRPAGQLSFPPGTDPLEAEHVDALIKTTSKRVRDFCAAARPEPRLPASLSRAANRRRPITRGQLGMNWPTRSGWREYCKVDGFLAERVGFEPNSTKNSNLLAFQQFSPWRQLTSRPLCHSLCLNTSARTA